MIKIPINFRKTDDIVKFVEIANQYPFHMDLVSHADRLSLMIHSYPSPSTDQLLTQMQSFT